MKRTVLASFILFAALLMWLPNTRPLASKRINPRAIAERKRIDPHEGMYARPDITGQASLATIQVARTLPQSRELQRIRKSKILDPGTLKLINPIDEEIFGKLAAGGVEPAQPASDEEFCRRLHLDITGRQPSPERLVKYVSDADPQKKDKLIGELIGSDAYIDRWTQWLSDLTHSYAIAVDRRDRNTEYLYLRDAVIKNKRFNQIAADLITFKGRYDEGPGGFIVRPVYQALIDQDSFDELAAESARTFLGTQAVCISCHDGEGHLEQVNLFYSTRKRAEYWGLAAFFAEVRISFPDAQFKNVRIVDERGGTYLAKTDEGMRPPRKGGVIAPSYGLYGEGKPNSGELSRAALARLITADPQFARAFINRVFAHFFTLGLVEPLDSFDLARLDPENPPPAPWELQPSHPVLLQRLADFFIRSGYDMRALFKLMASSEAYALSSRYDESKWKPEYARLYARKLARRLQAEEVLDAITSATLVPGAYAAVGFDHAFDSAMSLPGTEEPSAIRNGPNQSDNPEKVYFFLQNFGRGDRRAQPRTDNSSITQALSMFNSELIIRRISSDAGLPNQLSVALAQGKANPEQAAAFLYLNTIGRLPSSAEMEKIKPIIGSGRQTVADLQWALLNRLDFLYNY